MSETRNRPIGRRDFLTRLFRSPNRGTPPLGAEDRDRSPRGPRDTEGAPQPSDALRANGWYDDARTDRDFTAPECAPESLVGESNMERVLKELSDWTGIEDP